MERLALSLRPELVCPRLTGDKQSVLSRLADCVARAHPSLEAREILEGVARRERLGSMALGRGIAFCHVRTEAVPELTWGLVTTPEGVRGFDAPDDVPVKVIALFLVPKRHSGLYLRMVAFLSTALSDPAIVERILAATTAEEILAALQPSSAGAELTAGLEHLAKNGPADDIAAELLDRVPAVDLASLAEDLTPQERANVLAKLNPVRGAAIAERMHLLPLAAALRRMPRESAAALLTQMDAARVADIIRRLNADEQASLLSYMMSRDKGEVRTLLKYPPSKAGGFMRPEVVALGPEATVEQALRTMAAFKDRRQTDVYVITEDRVLLGKCSLHDLVVESPGRALGELMQRRPETVPPDCDHVDVRRLMALKDLHSVPVVGRDGKLLGVVTQDDLLDVIEREVHEDIVNIAGAKVVDPLHTPLGLRIRLRMPWLLLTLGGELFIALVITKIFRPTLEKAVVLAAFIPAIMATGGNVGLQATTIIIRALGLGSVKSRHLWPVVFHEVRLGAILGLCCGVMAGVVAYLINWGHHEVFKISASVFLSMLSATVATSFVGTLEPLLLHRLKFDPATACGPFVTMFNDIFGSIVYLVIAMLMNFSPPT
jgi:magnesium transporter